MYRIKNMLPDLDERGQTLNSRDSALQRDYDQTVSLVKTYGQQVPSSETRRRLQQEAFADAQKEPGILNRTVTRPSQDSSSTSPPPKPPGNAGPAQNQAQLPPEAGLSQIFRALRFNPT